jgi:hypothetical protein
MNSDGHLCLLALITITMRRKPNFVRARFSLEKFFVIIILYNT